MLEPCQKLSLNVSVFSALCLIRLCEFPFPQHEIMFLESAVQKLPK